MSAIVVLGSKPQPALPPLAAIDALACANGSGASAHRYGLPTPLFTVMSAILSSGIESGRQSLQALADRHTNELHFFPRPPKASSVWRQLRQPLLAMRTRPAALKQRLAAVGFGYERFIDHDYRYYQHMIERLCDHDETVAEQMARKQPSTGLMTIAMALARGEHDQVIVSGFSFELTHDYDRNPEIDQRGTAVSRHADTDITILRHLAGRYAQLITTEPVVAEHTGIPLYPDSSPR